MATPSKTLEEIVQLGRASLQLHESGRLTEDSATLLRQYADVMRDLIGHYVAARRRCYVLAALNAVTLTGWLVWRF